MIYDIEWYDMNIFLINPMLHVSSMPFYINQELPENVVWI